MACRTRYRSVTIRGRRKDELWLGHQQGSGVCASRDCLPALPVHKWVCLSSVCVVCVANKSP